MNIKVELQLASPDEGVPAAGLFRDWVNAAASLAAVNARGDIDEAELAIRVVGSEESRALNHRYRRLDRPTNVLAFPAEVPEYVGEPALGDLVICRDVVLREAREQGKPEQAHWAHMVVHGTLHLLGHDHQDADQAREMEALEVQILDRLGYADPYRARAGSAPPAARAEDATP